MFTKRERWLIFSLLKKSCFLRLTLLLKFWIQWYLNILNWLKILMMLNKCIIWWFLFDVTFSALYFPLSVAFSRIFSWFAMIFSHFLKLTKWIKVKNVSSVQTGWFLLNHQRYKLAINIVFVEFNSLFILLMSKKEEIFSSHLKILTYF